VFVLHPVRECALVTSLIAGRSHRQSAKYAGVSKRTATTYAAIIKSLRFIEFRFIRDVKSAGFSTPLHRVGDSITLTRRSTVIVSALAAEGYIFARIPASRGARAAAGRALDFGAAGK